MAARPVVEALAHLLETVPTLLLVFTSEGVFVGTHPEDVQPHEATWLSSRLTARGVASLAFAGGLSEEDAQRLIAWLATDEELRPRVEAPSFGACVITGIDYSRAQFREAPATREHGLPAALAWRGVARSLTDDWSSPDSEVPSTPDELAHRVLGMLERQEGAGVGELNQRLVGVTSQLAGLSDDVRAAVKGRLAEFLGALTPELRERLLTATPRDDAPKLDLLTQLVDRLPRSCVVDMVSHLKFERGGSTHQFMALILKLTGIASGDSAVAEALASRCRREGLPLDPASLNAPQAQQALEQVLTPRAGDVDDINPREYQAQLEALSTKDLRRGRPASASDRHSDPRDARCVSGQAARIALYLLQSSEGEDGDTEVCLARVQQEFPHQLAERRLDLLGEAAGVFQLVAQTGVRDSAVVHRAQAGLEFFASAAVVDEVVAFAESAADPASGPLMVLARAGGVAGAEAVLTRLSRRPAREVASRLGALLGGLNPPVCRSALRGLYHRAPSVARPIVSALLAVGGGPTLAGLGQELLDDADAAVRADACRLAFSSPGAVQVEAVLARALQDDDARVAEVGIDAVEHHETLLGASALWAFLAARRPASVALLQHRLVRVLARHPAPRARLILIDALGHRQSRFDRAGRLLSRSIAVALERTGGMDGAAAVNAWRRSPAGLVSRLLGDVAGGAA